MYEIEFDAARRLFIVRAEGFWSLGTIAGFSAAALAQGAWARARHGRYAVLADARAFPVQSAEVARAFEMLVAKSIALSDAPYAVVLGSMLAKMQADRVVNGPNCRTFLDLAEAEGWLEESWGRQRAA